MHILICQVPPGNQPLVQNLLQKSFTYTFWYTALVCVMCFPFTVHIAYFICGTEGIYCCPFLFCSVDTIPCYVEFNCMNLPSSDWAAAIESWVSSCITPPSPSFYDHGFLKKYYLKATTQHCSLHLAWLRCKLILNGSWISGQLALLHIYWLFLDSYYSKFFPLIGALGQKDPLWCCLLQLPK